MNGKENVVYMHNGIVLSPKKEENSAMCNKMDLEGIRLSEISQIEKGKHCLVLFICGI